MSKHDRIKEERKRLKYTQQEIADLCGVHRVQWGRYERGEQGFDGQPLRTFGEFGADISYILTGTRTPEVEMTVLDKVTKAEKNAQATGNKAGADNLAQAVDDMVAGQIRRGKNAQRRADELRQIMYMLCDMDDEAFENAYQAIADIHTQQKAPST